VLDLTDKVCGDDVGVGRFVSNHRDFRGAGEHIDPDSAEQRTLGLGDELVARTDDDIRTLAREQAMGHRRDRLHPAQRHHDIRAGSAHCEEHIRMNALPLKGRRAGDHGRDASGLRGCDRHIGRRDVGIAPARHVAAGHVARHEFLAGNQPRRQLHLEVPDALPLRHGKVAHACDCPFDVTAYGNWDVLSLLLDRLSGHDNVP